MAAILLLGASGAIVGFLVRAFSLSSAVASVHEPQICGAAAYLSSLGRVCVLLSCRRLDSAVCWCLLSWSNAAASSTPVGAVAGLLHIIIRLFLSLPPFGLLCFADIRATARPVVLRRATETSGRR